MSAFIVEGKHQLNGSISITGNKNEALPLIAAALLFKEPVALSNVPDIGDVRIMLEIARKLGAQVSPINNGTVTIDAGGLSSQVLPAQMSSDIRASVLFASSLLVRSGKAIIQQPGGDAIGRRRLDTHFHVLQNLGATLDVRRESIDGEALTSYILEAPAGLSGTELYLDEASVTATENAIIAAVGARGRTVIINAACEPHVVGLCRFLEKSGVRFEGLGSNIITVHGTHQIKPAPHRIGSDYIEAGSFVGLAAATGSEITITDVDLSCMRMILYQFGRIGVVVEQDPAGRKIRVPAGQTLEIRTDMGGAIPKIEDSPWPGFPSDLVSIMLVAATQARGTCLIHEKMFESRLFFVDKLLTMGAQIVLCDPHRAVVVGPSPLKSATLSSPDIRAGMALLIAALTAEGKSIIQNIHQIDRGYQQIDIRLQKLGARIERIPERRKSRI
jgi:UDP-N-acetylglucosamine 1-carboxyvinyltransferase